MSQIHDGYGRSMNDGVVTGIPASDIRYRLRHSLSVGGFLLALSLVLAGWGFAEWRQERVLDGGPRVQAEVVDTDSRRHQPDVVVVRYQVEGQRYEEALPADIGALDPGDRIEIVYDPAEPSHARPVRGWSPAYEYLGFYAPLIAIMGIAGLIYERTNARATIRAIDTGTGTGTGTGTDERMWVRHLRRWSWARRGYQHLAALWYSESEPPAERKPDLVVEVESKSARYLENGPVSVHGILKPGGRAVLRVGGHTIWPDGKVRSELPQNAKPV